MGFTYIGKVHFVLCLLRRGVGLTDKEWLLPLQKIQITGARQTYHTHDDRGVLNKKKTILPDVLKKKLIYFMRKKVYNIILDAVASKHQQ